jgi:hypothetical protein
MLNVGIPLFDLKSSKDYIFIAGGGGNKEYGKENGVMAIKKSSLNENLEKVSLFYKTADFITYLQIYTENVEESDNLYKDISLEEAPETADGFNTSDESMTIPFDQERSEDISSSSEDLNNEQAKIDQQKIDQQKADQEINLISQNRRIDLTSKERVKKVTERKPTKALFILAIGDENLYILKFTNSFSLHCKIEKRFNFAFLNKSLFLLKNGKFLSFFDLIQNPSTIHFKIKEIEENTSDPAEEYVYKLYKRKTEVIPLNEYFTRDIPKNWNGFFIFENKIHKILKNEKMNVFVFKNQKYEIEGNISRIIVQKDGLIFYSNTEKDGNLYFIDSESNEEATVYKLPKITAFDIYRNLTIVATVQGNAIIYQNGSYLQRTNISHVPVTGIAIDYTKIYYTQLDGQVKWQRRVSNFEKAIKRFTIITLVVSFITYFVYYLAKYFMKSKNI